MARQKTTLLIIPDTSDGSEFLILPETHKYYRRLITFALIRSLKSHQGWEILGRTLVTICHYAYYARQFDVLREVSDFLVSTSFRDELRTIGLYYQGQVLHGAGQIDAARLIFEKLATDTRFPWKPRAIASLGGCYRDSGELDTAIAVYLEAQRAALEQGSDAAVLLRSRWMIGAIRNVQGDHEYAVESLENLYPLVLHVAKTDAATYYDYLNSLAVRHTVLGHFSQAERLCEITLSSPFARNFPNWAETRDEIFAAKDAAAATVYVNIETGTNLKADTESDHVESTLKNASLDVTVPDIAVDRSAESELNPKPHPDNTFRIRFAIILSGSRRRTSRPASITVTGLRATLCLSDAVPDNHRPRAPPTT
jgi:hypothetical protein